jgi:hypothetical protein
MVPRFTRIKVGTLPSASCRRITNEVYRTDLAAACATRLTRPGGEQQQDLVEPRYDGRGARMSYLRVTFPSKFL